MHLDVRPRHLHSMKMPDPRLQMSDRRDLTVTSQVRHILKGGISTFTTKDCLSTACKARPRFGSRRTRIIRTSTNLMQPFRITPNGRKQYSTTSVGRTVDGLNFSSGLSKKPNPFCTKSFRSNILAASTLGASHAIWTRVWRRGSRRPSNNDDWRCVGIRLATAWRCGVNCTASSKLPVD